MSEHHSIEYRTIPDYPGYRIGDDGSVWSQWRTRPSGRFLSEWRRLRECVKKNRTFGRAYRYLNLTDASGKVRTFRVHRLVLMAFVGPCPEGMESRHKDGNPSNNCLTNLAWGTKEENTQDNRDMGRYTATERAKMFTHDGQTLCLKDWARLKSISYTRLWQRIFKLGWSFEKAIVDSPRRC